MDIYKQFLYELRILGFKQVHIIINQNVVPKLKHYLKLLLNISFDDGSYHTYYDEIKKIVVSFTLHWTLVMDDTVKEADKYMNNITKEEIIDLTEKTIYFYHELQTDFGNQFLPITNEFEQKCYNEIQEKFQSQIEKLSDLKENLNILDKPEKVEAFAKENFTVSLKAKNNCFECAARTIASYLAKNREKIRISLEENVKSVSNYVRNINAQRSAQIKDIHHRLYEKNKEYLDLLREKRPPFADIAEVLKSIKLIKSELKHTDTDVLPINRFLDELHFWENRLHEFKLIEDTLDKLEVEEKRTTALHESHLLKKAPDFSEIKLNCWSGTEKKITAQLEHLRQLKSNASSAILTFFSVRGHDRMFYADNIGAYYVDEFGHQVYICDYRLSVWHVNCAGEYIHACKKDRHYYDQNGRYVLRDEKKLYQAGTCTSTYELRNGLYVKHSKDCGHSENHEKNCHMEIKDPNDIVLLPLVEYVNIKDKLDKESADYLWSNLGAVLSEALRDVAELQPKNPIHCLAHKLLYHKYKRTNKEMVAANNEAKEYKLNILQDRKAKLIAAYKAWKEKQVKRRKPDEADDIDTYAFAVYADQQAMFATWDYYY